jgi:hypothetical protein
LALIADAQRRYSACGTMVTVMSNGRRVARWVLTVSAAALVTFEAALLIQADRSGAMDWGLFRSFLWTVAAFGYAGFVMWGQQRGPLSFKLWCLAAVPMLAIMVFCLSRWHDNGAPVWLGWFGAIALLTSFGWQGVIIWKKAPDGQRAASRQ